LYDSIKKRKILGILIEEFDHMKIPRTTLEQWRVLQAIVEYGGFAQAAEALHRSQSSVSYTVGRLQEQLGLKLLEIHGRKAKLTESGETLLRHAEELLGEALKLEKLAHSLVQGWEAEIRLVVDALFPTPLLLRMLREFAPLSPHTRVLLSEEVLSGTDEALIMGRADLAIGGQVPPGFLGDHVLDVELVAVAHPDHPLHRLGRTLDADDLNRELHVVVSDSGTLAPRDSGWLGATRRWSVTSPEKRIALLCAGLGFGWIPCHLIEEPLASGRLKPLPLRDGQRRKVPLYLIFAQPKLAGPATRKLAELIRACAAEGGTGMNSGSV
jgi:DNA-binding transcriptional LysR family regulator